MTDGRDGTRLSGDSRGQLLLIVGLLLATVFVSLAVVVNSGIYTENLASRESTDAEAVGIDQAAVDDGVLATVNRANANVETTSYTTLLSTFDAMLAGYDDAIGRSAGINGRYIDVEKTGDEQGVRLRQTNESRNMTSRHGDWNWTLTDGPVEDSGHFTMTLQQGSLYEVAVDTTLAAMADSAYGIEFELQNYTGSGDGVWRVYFFAGAATDNLYAIVERPDQTFRNNQADAINDGYLAQSCALTGDSVSVRLNQSTFGGRYCDDFDFYGPSIGDHTIRFVNARSDSDPTGLLDGLASTESDRARGAYDIMLGTHPPNTTAFHAVGNGQPWHQAAIYSVSYDLTYRSSGTTYTTDARRVVPTESDPGGVIRQHPNVDRFDVTDRTDEVGDPTFEIDWTVSDVDRDLDRVEFHLVHNVSGTTSLTNEVVNETEVQVANGSATGTTDLCDCGLVGSVGNDYRIQITVVDTSGRATTRSVVRTAG